MTAEATEADRSSVFLHDASAGAVGIGYALDLFRRLGFAAENVHDGLLVTVPTYRGEGRTFL